MQSPGRDASAALRTRSPRLLRGCHNPAAATLEAEEMTSVREVDCHNVIRQGIAQEREEPKQWGHPVPRALGKQEAHDILKDRLLRSEDREQTNEVLEQHCLFVLECALPSGGSGRRVRFARNASYDQIKLFRRQRRAIDESVSGAHAATSRCELFAIDEEVAGRREVLLAESEGGSLLVALESELARDA